jgi:hypothetical protein
MMAKAPKVWLHALQTLSGGQVRKEPTKAEQVALHLLSQTLTARGTRPMYAVDITDSPDALFFVEDKAIAIECRYIAHPKLLEFMGRRDLLPDVPYEVVVPREPHLWVKHAILEKNKNIEKYMKKTGATEAWLLVHSSTMHPMLVGKPDDEVIKILLTLGTHLVEHGFTRIWFAEVGGHLQEAIELYGPNITRPKFDWDAYVASFAPGYPHTTHWFSPAVVKERDDGEKYVSVNMNDPQGKVIGLQPLDTSHKLDYSFLSDAQRNSDLSGLAVTFYDQNPKY